jgi:hypothetical protein
MTTTLNKYSNKQNCRGWMQQNTRQDKQIRRTRTKEQEQEQEAQLATYS